jgi:hypothetical protein
MGMNNFGIANLGYQQHDFDLINLEATRAFEAALKKNFWHSLTSRLTGTRRSLLDYGETLEKVPFEGQYDAGIQSIPVDHIVGTLGKGHDFDASYLPRSEKTRLRWVKIARASLLSEYIPPVEVIQIGALYFVIDGHHRVSVAHALNQAYIEAHVVKIQIPEELAKRTDLEEAMSQYEREAFLKKTNILEICPEANIQPTVPGFYQKITKHISAHRWLMGIERGAKIPRNEAVADWYERVYQPIVEAVRAHHLLTAFPGKAEADLYVWISEYHWLMKEKSAEDISYEDAAVAFAQQSAGMLHRMIWQIIESTSQLN